MVQAEGVVMVASHRTIDQIVTILLKYMRKDKALLLARDLYQHVETNKSVNDTFKRVCIRIAEVENDK